MTDRDGKPLLREPFSSVLPGALLPSAGVPYAIVPGSAAPPPPPARIRAWRAARAVLPLLFSAAVFVAALRAEGRIAGYLEPPAGAGAAVPEAGRRAAARCAAVFALVVALWATAAVPLYATALAVAPLAVGLRVFVDAAGAPLAPHAAADAVLRAMGADAVFMVLGVYALGAALGKTGFEHLMARVLLRFATSSLRLLALAMVLAVAVSMFVSNVFAPVLLLSVLTPVFHGLDSESLPLVKSIILGISVASNIGGMPSPVSSPQNIVARALMHKDAGGVSFLTWFAATLPQCALMLGIGFLLIVARFRTHRFRLRADEFVRAEKAPITLTDVVVSCTFAITILLWVSPLGDRYFGKAGVVAMIPVVILFGTGTLDLDDFKRLPWNVIYLVAGGTAMGKAIESSHLLNLVAYHLSAVLQRSSIWGAFCIVVVFMAVVAEGISHTVSAIIVLPLVEKVGVELGHPRLLVMGGVLACSGAMSLPVSSFPNMSAFGVTDPVGVPYLTAADILISGLPMTLASSAVISTLGFFIMSVVLGM